MTDLLHLPPTTIDVPSDTPVAVAWTTAPGQFPELEAIADDVTDRVRAMLVKAVASTADPVRFPVAADDDPSVLGLAAAANRLAPARVQATKVAATLTGPDAAARRVLLGAVDHLDFTAGTIASQLSAARVSFTLSRRR